MIHNDFELLVYLLIASPLLYLECKLVHYYFKGDKEIEEIPQFKGTLEELDNLTLGEKE